MRNQVGEAPIKVGNSSQLFGLALFSIAAFLLSRLTLVHIGISPVFPAEFVLMLLLLPVPFAIFFEYVAAMPEYGRVAAIVCAASAVLIVVALHKWSLWQLLAVAACAIDYRRPRQWELLTVCIIVTIFGYGTLWNINYILLHNFGPSLHDQTLRTMDLAFYSFFGGSSINYTNLFPLVRDPTLLLIFGNAYTVLFGEIVLAVLLICQTGDANRAVRFLITLFGLYACGVIVFMIYPAAGPFLYFPESISSAGSFLLNGMATDYRVIMTGKGTLTGFGYFIAVPSLHILIVLFLQTFLFRYRRLFYVFLPINLLLIPSTVVLGYHYVMDLAVAFVIAAPICVLFFRAEAKSVAVRS